ncbi:CPBP family intramembrane metalloprotease [Candidatus Bathyarchaeota archaeon]|nr:CPBP family intramembrane metalloprotease [Candidatus Bathyarchaeota archaeon]
MDSTVLKPAMVYFALTFVLFVSAYLFDDLPVFLSILLLLPLILWCKNYLKKAKLSKEPTVESRETMLFWVLMLFALALVVRVPFVMLFGAPYEKTPLVYLVILTIVLVEKTDIKPFGFKTGNIIKSALYGLLLFSLLDLIALAGIHVLTSVFTNQRMFHSFNVVAFLISMPFMTLCVGISEEGLFRGYMQTHMQRHFSVATAVLLQAFLFGVWHFVWHISPLNLVDMTLRIASTFFVGVMFGYFYSKSRNLVPLILAHGLWNSILDGLTANPEAANAVMMLPLLSQAAIIVVPYALSTAATFFVVKKSIREI